MHVTCAGEDLRGSGPVKACVRDDRNTAPAHMMDEMRSGRDRNHQKNETDRQEGGPERRQHGPKECEYLVEWDRNSVI